MAKVALSPRWFLWASLSLSAAGCLHPVQERVDSAVADFASHPRDLQPLALPAADPGKMEPVPEQPKARVPLPEKDTILPTAAEDRPANPATGGRLEIPPELPGVRASEIKIPLLTPTNKAERDEAIRRQLGELPPLGPEPPLAPGPDGKPLALADLQRIAVEHNPVVRQAMADVEAAQGAAVQAGLPPNPTVGYEGDTMGTAGLAGYQGGFVEQTIKTAGKLKLAQAAAQMDIANAELALKKAQNDLATDVRGAYFAVLVARENLKIARAVARFTEEVYRVEVDLLRGAQAAAYEVVQFRALALQARGNVIQAHNRHVAAWKQLAAALGQPDLPPTQLVGHAEMPVPDFDYHAVLGTIIEKHTDVLTALNSMQRARYSLRLAQVTPISDVDLRVMLQKDYTSNTFLLTPSVMLGLQVPVWDRNQGAIQQAQAQLLRASGDPTRVRNELTGELAERFERYDNNRRLVELYRNQVLPDLVRVYRGVYQRYQAEAGAVNFNDVSTAQQNLVNAVNAYLGQLLALWTAVVDVADLLQTDNLFQFGPEKCPQVLPSVEEVLGAPAVLPKAHE